MLLSFMSKRVLLAFASRSFIVSSFILKSLISLLLYMVLEDI